MSHLTNEEVDRLLTRAERAERRVREREHDLLGARTVVQKSFDPLLTTEEQLKRLRARLYKLLAPATVEGTPGWTVTSVAASCIREALNDY